MLPPNGSDVDQLNFLAKQDTYQEMTKRIPTKGSASKNGSARKNVSRNETVNMGMTFGDFNNDFSPTKIVQLD